MPVDNMQLYNFTTLKQDKYKHCYLQYEVHIMQKQSGGKHTLITRPICSSQMRVGMLSIVIPESLVTREVGLPGTPVTPPEQLASKSSLSRRKA